MISVPKAVKDVVEMDGFLHFGLSNGVLNLSKTAKFIQPLVAVRTKKNISVSAITMALSRLKLEKRKMNAYLQNIKISSLNVTKELTGITYERAEHTTQQLEGIKQQIREKGGYCVCTFGTAEITVLVDASEIPGIQKEVEASPKITIPRLVAIGISFDKNYYHHVGIVYALVQQLTFQNIGIVEFSSTYTELIFYLHEKDLKVAFDTFNEQFM